MIYYCVIIRYPENRDIFIVDVNDDYEDPMSEVNYFVDWKIRNYLQEREQSYITRDTYSRDRAPEVTVDVYKTTDNGIADFFFSSEREDILEYIQSEEFAREYYSPNGIGGKKNKEELEDYL